MRNRRYILPAGSAVAAALILAVLLTTPTPRSAVEAGTILSNLRETLHRGFSVTFENIGDGKGALVDGRVWMLFNRGFSLAELAGSDEPIDLALEEICLDIGVELGEDAEELADLKMRIAVALSEEEQWVYMQVNDITPLIEHIGPAAMFFAGYLQNGLLLELTGLLDGEFPISVTGNLAEDSDLVDAQAGAAHAPRYSYSYQTKFKSRAAVDADSSEPAMDEEIGELLGKWLSGKVTPEEFDQFVAKIEEAFAQVHVDEVEPGLYVLTASDFSGLHDEVEPGEAKWLTGLMLEIAYREEVGVEWATLSNVGPAAGELRFEFIDDARDVDRITRDEYYQEGVTTMFDLGGLVKSLEALSGGLKNESGDGE